MPWLCHCFILYSTLYVGFPGDSVVQISLPRQEMQETQVWSLGGEDPLEEEMVTHSSGNPVLDREIPWTEEPDGWLSMGLQRVGCDWTQHPMCTIVPIYLFICLLCFFWSSNMWSAQRFALNNTCGYYENVPLWWQEQNWSRTSNATMVIQCSLWQSVLFTGCF